ncbi:MAG: membrane protein insertion efficiency factor YidD [candidate division WOR-3 bacterium]|nr:membrane protein insertion efficiency factor YidD [candidate division WOR-3 bacterium]
MTSLMIMLINLYQTLISPLLPKVCRFYPSCSEYTKLSLEKYGLLKGLLLGFKRVLRCHPFDAGGYDPIP